MKRFALKRITALVLALIMTLSLCPVSAFAAFAGDTWEPPKINGVTIYGGSNPSSGSDPGSVGYQLPYYYDGITIENNTVFVPSRPNQAKTVWLLSTKTLSVDPNNSEGATLTPCADPATAWGEPVYCLVMPTKDSGHHSVDVTVTDTDAGTTANITFTFGFEGVYFNDVYFYTAVDSQGYFTFNNRGTCDDMWFERTVDENDNQSFSFKVPFDAGQEKTLYIRPARGDIASMAVTGGSLYDSEVADPTTDLYDFVSYNSSIGSYAGSYKLTLTTNVTGNGSIYVTYYDGSGNAVDGADIQFTAQSNTGGNNQGGNNQGSGIPMACGVSFLTTFDSTTQTYDESVVTWGDQNGAYAYVVCGEAAKTIYLAIPTWDKLSVTKGSADVNPTLLSDTWTNSDGATCNVYALNVGLPSSGNTEVYTEVYTITRSDANGNNAESLTLTCDFYPTFSSGFEGTAFAMNCGVAMFTKLDNGSLGYNENVLNDYGSATVMSLGKTEQTVYLAAGVNGTVTVDDDALTQIGTWFNPIDNRYSKVYVYTETKQAGDTVVRTIARNDDNSESFNLTFDFTPVFNSSEGFDAFARGVHLFTDKSGSDLSVDDSVVVYGNENEQFMYVACGVVGSRTVYLAANQWDTLSVKDANGNTVSLSEVGMWPTQYTNGDGSSFDVTCKVYEMTVSGNGGIVDYTVTRAWVDNGNPYSEDFKLTFDFYPVITGPLFNAERGVAIFNKLSGGTFDYDHGTPIYGYGDSAEVICFGKTSQTVYLAVGVHDKLSVSDSAGNPASLTRVGTWKSTNTMMPGPWVYEVYEMTAPVSNVTTYNVVRTGYDGGNREEFALSFKSESLDDYTLGMWGVRFFGGYDSTKKVPIYEGNLFSEKNNTITVTAPGLSSKTVYLGFDDNDPSLTVTKDGDPNKTNLLTDTGGVWKDKDGYQYKIYALTVAKESGDTVNCTFTRGNETFPIIFDFSRRLGNFGRTEGCRADAILFTGMDGNNLYYDDSFMTWSDADGEYIYGACGNVSQREVYLAFNMWHNYEVTDSNGSPVTLTPVDGTWRTPFGNYKVYKMPAVMNPGAAGEPVEYTITRSWSWFGDHDEDANTADQLVTESESTNLVFDFSPTFTGNVWNSFYNVSFFYGLDNGQLLGEGGAFNGYGDRVVIPVEDENQLTITRYVTVPLDNNLIVNDGSQNLNLQQEGLLLADGRIHKVYALSVDKPADGDVVEFNVTREWTWWDNNNPVQEQYSFPLIFSFDPNYEVEGDGPVNARGVFIFTTKNGDDLGYDDSFIAQWGDTSGEKVYLPCGDSSPRTVYLAANQYDTLNVSGAATLSNVGTWVNGDQTCNVYELTVEKPATGKTAEYTVTRSWSYMGDHDGDPDTADQLINDSEYFTLIFDFAPTLTGDIELGFWNVLLFNELNGTNLSLDWSSASAWSDGTMQHAYFVFGNEDKTQKVYLATDMNGELTVKNGTSPVALNHVGTTTFKTQEGNDWLCKVYEVPVSAPASGSTVEYTVTKTQTWWDNNNQPVTEEHSFPITFDFAPILTGNIEIGAENVLLFTDLNGTELICDTSSVAQWGDATGEHMYVAYGDTAGDQKVYLATSPMNTLTVKNGTSPVTINHVGVSTFKADDGSDWLCKVYEVPVTAPTSGDVVEYTVTNNWTWWDDMETPDGSDDVPVPMETPFTLTADFAPVLTGDLRNMECGVAIFSSLTDGVLSGDNSITGLRGSAVVASEGSNQKTVFLAVGLSNELTVNDSQQDLQYEGLWPFDGWYCRVYSLTVDKPASGDTVEFKVARNWTHWENNQPTPQSDSFPLIFDFTLSPGEMPPLTIDGIKIYSYCQNGELGYRVPYVYDELGVDDDNNFVMVPSRPNQDKTIYLASAEPLYLDGVELPKCTNPATEYGKTVYELTADAKDFGDTFVNVAMGAPDSTTTITVRFGFFSVMFIGTSFYTTVDENSDGYFTYEDRTTCDGLSVEWLDIGNESHFYLNVPFAVGQKKVLYINPDHGAIASLAITNGSLETKYYSLETIEDSRYTNDYGKYYKLTLSDELNEQKNLMFELYDENKEVIGNFDVQFTPIYEAKWGLATGDSLDELPTSWTRGTLSDAMSYANSLTSGTAYIQLLKDMDTTAPLVFDSGKTTILDLNGNTIDRKLTAATPNGSVITVDGTLTICDTSATAATAPGKITGGNTTANGGGVNVNGQLIMTAGEITGNAATRAGGGVALGDNGIMTVSGNVKITGNTVNGEANNVHIEEPTPRITVGELASGAKIGVTMATFTTQGDMLMMSRWAGVFTSGGANYVTNGYFTSDCDDFMIVSDSSNLMLAVKRTVSFDANNGTDQTANPFEVADGRMFALPPRPQNTITAPESMQFKGWAYFADGAVITDSFITVTSDIVLYAIWENIPAEAPVVETSADLSLTYGEYSDQKVSVAVTKQPGYSYTYQWYDADNNAIGGATNESYAIANDLTAGTHSYYCVVTATREDNSETATATSATITVTVAKATPDVTAPAELTATYGQTLADVQLPTDSDGTWSWKDDTKTSVGNAGDNTFMLVFTPNDLDNYESVEVEAKVAVAKKQVAIPEKDTTHFEYDGKVQTYDVAVSDLYTVTGTTRTEAGSQNVTITLKDKANYEWNNNNPTADLVFDFAIARRMITVTADAATKTFGEADPALTYTVDRLVEGETLKGDLERVAGEDAGTYAIEQGTLTVANNPNYNITYKEAEFTITKADATVTVPVAQQLAYTGSAQALVSAGSTTGGTMKYALGTDATTAPADGFGESVPMGTVAGTYYVWYFVDGGNNYNDEAAQCVTVTIAKQQVTKPLADDSEFVYNGKEQTYSVLNTNLYTISNNKRTAAGEQTVTVTLNDTANYEWADGTTAAVEFTFTIAKAQPSYTIPVGLVATYGQTLADVKLPAGWAWVDVATTSVGAVGSNKFAVEFTPADIVNYNKVSGTATITVNKQQIAKPDADDTKFVYTGVAQTYTVAASELYTVSGNTRIEAGSQTVTIALTDKENYAWVGGSSDDLQYTFTIAKAPLTITANAKTITYGAAPANAGVEYKGFVNGETEAVLTGALNYSYNYKQYGDVGAYAITPAGLSSDNYGITFVNGTLTVEQKEIGIEWGNTDLTYSGKAQAPTATATGMVNGDEVTLAVSGEQTNASAEAYTATVTAVSNSNYKLPAAVTMQFTIAKAQPSYTIPVGLTATYGQTLADVKLPADWAWVDATQSVGNVGSNKFAVEFTPKDTINYNKVSGTATITVNKQQIAKPATDDTKFVYTGVVQTYTVVASPLYTVSNTTRTAAGEQKVTIALTDKTNYAWIGGSSDDLEYTFTIGKAPLIVTANAKTITYGAAPANAGVEYKGFVNNETEAALTGTLSYSYNYKQYGNVGKYTITPAGLSSDNYAITFVNGTLTVEQKEIGIKWGNTDLTYSGEAQAPTATATGMVNGDEVTLTVSGEQTIIGSYTATVTGLVGDKAGNYKLPANVTTAFTVDYATVTFNTNGAGTIEAIENLTYGNKITEPSKPEKAKHTFAGWFSDEKCTKLWVFEKDTITGDMTLYAKWSENPVYEVSGVVYEQPGNNEHSQKAANAHVQLMLGTTVVVEQTTNENGEFFFGGQEEGDYNLVVTYRPVNSKHDKVVTVLVALHEHNADDIEVVLPKHVTNSKVEHKNNNPEVEGEPDTGIATGTLVGGLDVVAETLRKQEEQKVDTSSGNVEASEVVAKVEVTLTVEDTPPVTNPKTEEEKQVQKEQVAIQQKAPGKEVVFFDLSVLMSVTDKDDKTDTEYIHDTGSLLEIRIPFEKGNKSGITIYRYHGDQAEALPEVNEDSQTEGFWVGDDGYIHIYTHKFSTYAVGYTEPGNNTGGTPGGYYPIVTPTTPVEKPEDTKPEDTKPVVTPTTPVEDDVIPEPEDTTPVVPDAPTTDDAPAVDNTPADDMTPSDSGNSVGLWIGVALAVLVVAIIVVVILIKRKKA